MNSTSIDERTGKILIITLGICNLIFSIYLFQESGRHQSLSLNIFFYLIILWLIILYVRKALEAFTTYRPQSKIEKIFSSFCTPIPMIGLYLLWLLYSM